MNQKNILFFIMLILPFWTPINISAQAQQNPSSKQEVTIPTPEHPAPSSVTHPIRRESATPDLLEEAKKSADDENKFFYEFLNMLFTLGLIIAVLFIISWFLKRMVNSRIKQINVASNIKILEQRNLSTKANIYLVEILGKVYAIGESQNGLIRLAAFEEGEEEIEEKNKIEGVRSPESGV